MNHQLPKSRLEALLRSVPPAAPSDDFSALITEQLELEAVTAVEAAPQLGMALSPLSPGIHFADGVMGNLREAEKPVPGVFTRTSLLIYLGAVAGFALVVVLLSGDSPTAMSSVDVFRTDWIPSALHSLTLGVSLLIGATLLGIERLISPTHVGKLPGQE